jgi:hypothetical protein
MRRAQADRWGPQVTRAQRRRFAVAVAVFALAAPPALAGSAIVRLPKRSEGAVTAKLTGAPGASIGFYALTKKPIGAHGRPISVTWSEMTDLPITCTQGPLSVSTDGEEIVGTQNPEPVSASGAFSFAVPMAAYGYTGLTVTIAGRYSDHYKKVDGTVSLSEDPSPASYPAGAAGTDTGCTVSSTPFPWSAKQHWHTEKY